MKKSVTITLLILLLLPCYTDAKEIEAQKYQSTVIIDPSSMDDETRASIISSIAIAKKTNGWKKIVAQKGDNVYSIVNKEYRYFDSKHKKTSKVIADSIKSANKLDKHNTIKENQVLLIPPIAKRPYSKGSENKYSQVVTLSSNYPKLSSKDTAVKSPDIITSKPLQLASTWVYEMTPEENELFLASLPDSIKKKVLNKSLYSGPRDELADVLVSKPTDIQSIAISRKVPAESTKIKLGKLDKSVFGKYYLLDFYASDNDSCSHGNLVLDAAYHVLDEYGLQHLKNNIVPIELDFFKNKDFALKQIYKYITSQNINLKENLMPVYERLKKSKAPKPDKDNNIHSIPLLYLQALYSNLISQSDTSLISSSFYTYFEGYKVLPPTYMPDSNISLITAVLDDSKSIIEDFAFIEPLRTFHDVRKNYGVVLVGAEQDLGNYFGMVSKSGDGVTCLENGQVLGSSVNCSAVKKLGTSFSTPVIGVKLFLAKAFWKANDLTILANEAKLRLIMSSDILPDYVGKFASGGIPNLEKMLLLTGAFGLDKNDNFVSLNSAKSKSYIEVKNDNGGMPIRFVFQRGINGFSGLQVIGEQSFIFVESSMKWEKVDIVSIFFDIADGPPIKSIGDFNNKFKGVIVL